MILCHMYFFWISFLTEEITLQGLKTLSDFTVVLNILNIDALYLKKSML